VLLERDPSVGVLSARLMFTPSQLLAVHCSSGEPLSLEGMRLEENRLVVAGRSDLPSLCSAELFPETPSERTIGTHRDGKRLILFSEGFYYHQLQLSVDYRTRETWLGPVPEAQPDRLARTIRRLAQGDPLTLVVLGDSISEGANASGFTQAPPYQPSYPGLLVQLMERSSSARIDLHNYSKGCTQSAWGKEQSTRIIAAKPDLLIVGFGMNDATNGVEPAAFQRNIQDLLAAVRTALPECECIVISGMTPNPAWHPFYPKVRQDMHERLRGLAGAGVAFCDVYSIWTELVRRKGFFSLTGNGANHPNDFGHRLYADCLYSLFGLSETSGDRIARS
jgi:lysophospholipase L1-like esterase